jgi:Raf kinase inhibitor-like YbhB/YbcL family protein
MKSRTRCRCGRASTYFGQTMPLVAYLCCIIVWVQLNSCTPTNSHQTGAFDGVVHSEIHLISPAFAEGELLPDKYSRSGGNLSPPLKWTNVPQKTKSFTLLCNNPDTPGDTFVLWIVYNIPAEVRELPEGAFTPGKKPFTGTSGKNNFRHRGYDGPDPPVGKTQRCYFTLYALDTVLDLKPGARKTEVVDAMRGHILAEGKLMGRYKKDAS